MAQTAAAVERTSSGRFPAGVSGNPNGPGRRGYTDVAGILRTSAPRVARKVVALAMAGDMGAAALVLEHSLAAVPPPATPAEAAT